MNKVKNLVCVLLLLFASVATATPPNDFIALMSLKDSVVNWISQEYPESIDVNNIANNVLLYAAEREISPELIIGLISVESGFRSQAKSPHGAKGLTQVVPRYHKDKIRRRNLFDPKVAIEVGTAILKDCLDKTDDNRRRALKCYSGYRGKAATAYGSSVLEHTRRFRQHALWHASNNG